MYKSDIFSITSLEVSDAKSLTQMMTSNAERFQKYFPKTLSQNLTVEDSKAYILRKAIENKNKIEFTFAIKENESQSVTGLIILKELDMTKKEGELAYAIDEMFEGRGWMTIAVHELTNFAFNELRLKTLKIITHRINLGSCKIAEKNGFVWKKTLKKEFTSINGSPIDMELYTLQNPNVSESKITYIA
jgi:ribosomal-protein-alanine N-acetyltransferase